MVQLSDTSGDGRKTKRYTRVRNLGRTCHVARINSAIELSFSLTEGKIN